MAVGEVHKNVTLRCGSASGSRGLVTWYRNDSEPAFLVSSNSSLPPAAPRFSLMDAGALHIEALRLEDDGNYTCQEVLNETHWFPVRLEVASKWDWWGWAWGGGESLWKRSGMWALVTDDFGLGKLEASLGYTDPVSKKKAREL